VAYHGGQEAGSVSVGNDVKGEGISERLVAGVEGGADARSVRHRKRDLQHFRSGSPLGKNKLS